MHDCTFHDLPTSLTFGIRITRVGSLPTFNAFCEPPCPTLTPTLTQLATTYARALLDTDEIKVSVDLNDNVEVTPKGLPDNFEAMLMEAGLAMIAEYRGTILWLQDYGINDMVDNFIEQVRSFELPLTSNLTDVLHAESPTFETTEGTAITMGFGVHETSDGPKLVILTLPEKPEYPFAAWANELLLQHAQMRIARIVALEDSNMKFEDLELATRVEAQA